MKVAVIIPVYNAERFLPQTLDSILAQDYPGVEIYCLDDQSTDGAPAVLADYARRYPGRIHVSAWENHGVGPTLNRLMDELPPDVEAFAIADCDDYQHPKFISTLVKAMEETGADVAQCLIARVSSEARYPEGFPAGAVDESREIDDDMSCYLLRATAPRGWINYWNKLYRRTAVDSVRFRPGLDYEDDFFFSYEVNAAIKRKVRVNARLYAYRMNPDGVTSKVRYWQYVPSAALRIRLSLTEFLHAGRIPDRLRGQFLRELSKDAYRMVVRKNLKGNRDPAECRRLFQLAGERLREIETEFGFRPCGLNPMQRLLWRLTIGGHYVLAKALVFLT